MRALRFFLLAILLYVALFVGWIAMLAGILFFEEWLGFLWIAVGLFVVFLSVASEGNDESRI